MTQVGAGNCVVGKPSELTSHTSAAIAKLVSRSLDPTAVAIVEGGPAETQALLAERFDHIFYTGNGRVGQVVMEAAARRIAWGKSRATQQSLLDNTQSGGAASTQPT